MWFIRIIIIWCWQSGNVFVLFFDTVVGGLASDAEAEAVGGDDASDGAYKGG